jgi:hypothetical protein
MLRLIWALAAALGVSAIAAERSGDLTLELRVFNGTEEVTAQTRLTVHRAGERGDPLRQSTSADGRVLLQVPQGIYDVQAIHERDGRVLNIRWANRLVVMPYPDEGGQHLEVINFKNGFGALQIRGKPDTLLSVVLYEVGKRDKPAAAPVGSTSTTTYALFVVPAAAYDLLVRIGGKPSWYPALDVPLDRTRLWVIPDAQ